MSTAKLPSTSNPTDWAKLASQARRHLVWKEGKLLLPACLGLVCLSIIGMVVWGMAPSNSLNDNAAVFVAIALGGGAMAALVCGGMTFSPERENKTDAFLARLPLSGASLARTKIFTAAVYFLVSYLISVGAAFGLFAAFFNGTNWFWLLGLESVLGSMLPVAFFMPVIVFLWSVAYSRHSSSTLNVVLLAACSTILVPVILTGVMSLTVDFLGLAGNGLKPFLFYSMFVLKTVGLLAVIAWQHGEWLRPKSFGAGQVVSGVLNEPEQGAVAPASWGKSMQSLLWQTFRFHWAGTLIASLACGLYLAVSLTMFYTALMGIGSAETSLAFEFSNDLFAAAMGGVTGVFLFSKDQSGSTFKFFQQRADYPRRIWLSRIVGMLVVAALVILVVSIVNMVTYSAVVTQGQIFRMGTEYGGFEFDPYRYREGWRSPNAPYQISNAGLAYFYSLTFRTATMFFVVAAVGQLVSIFCRHGILNALLGIAFCCAATIWIRYVNWYQVPTWAYAWPIVLAGFGLSWAYAPAWIRGTRQFSWAFASTIGMLVVLVGCLVALRADRLNDFERHEYFADLEEVFENPEKLKAAGDARFEVARKIEAAKQPIELAWGELRDQGKGSVRRPAVEVEYTEAELNLVDKYSDEFAEILSLVKTPDVRYYFFQSPDASNKAREAKSASLSRILDLGVAASIGKGRSEFDFLFARYYLSASLSTYVHWTYTQRIVDWAEESDRTMGDFEYAVKVIESYLYSSLTAGHSHLHETQYFQFLERLHEHEQGDFNFITNFDLPWEIERSKGRFENDLLVDINQRYPKQSAREWLDSIAKKVDSFYKLERSDRADDAAPGRNLVMGDWQRNVMVGRADNYNNVYRLRFVKLRLALAAWKLENGSYPEKLVELEGKFLEVGEAKRVYQRTAYYPEGVDKPVVLLPYQSKMEFFPRNCQGAIPANTPFVLPWYSAPTVEALFEIETKGEDGSEVVSTTDPEVGYFMGENPGPHNGWGVESQQVERFILK